METIFFVNTEMKVKLIYDNIMCIHTGLSVNFSSINTRVLVKICLFFVFPLHVSIFLLVMLTPLLQFVARTLELELISLTPGISDLFE